MTASFSCCPPVFMEKIYNKLGVPIQRYRIRGMLFSVKSL